MSYILDALKRAERERKLGQAPTALDEIAVPPPASIAGGPNRWLIVGGAGIVLAALAIYGLMVFMHRDAAPAPTPAPVAAAPPQPAPLPVPVPQTPQPTANQDASIDDDSIASLDDLAGDRQDEAVAQPNSMTNQNSPNPAIIAPAPSPVAEPTVATKPAPRPSLSTTTSIDPAPASEAVENARAHAARIEALRRFKEMPPGYRAEFPAITVGVHVYNEDPQRSFVIINEKRYREGDTIAEGPRIAEIVSEGIVFEWRSEKVLYALGR